MSVSILVVDDEPDVADLFRQRFRREARQGTYVMHFAASGEQALELLADEIQPELIVILSDINMPGMDGLRIARRDQAASPRSAGHDGDRLWRRGAKTPRQRTRRFRVHHQAGRFRSVEGAATPIARRCGLRRRRFRLGSRGPSRPRLLCSILSPSMGGIRRSPHCAEAATMDHAVSPAANRKPDSKSSRCSGLRYGITLGTTTGVIARSRLTISRASSSRPICA